MIKNLEKDQLEKLLKTVFALKSRDKSMAIFMDLPNDGAEDYSDWSDTRGIIFEWYRMLSEGNSLGLGDIGLYCYENVGINNADMPATVYKIDSPIRGLSVKDIARYGQPVSLESALARTDVVLAPTNFSCTAPLKMLAKKHGFRAATMPGFKREMIPALLKPGMVAGFQEGDDTCPGHRLFEGLQQSCRAQGKDGQGAGL